MDEIPPEKPPLEAKRRRALAKGLVRAAKAGDLGGVRAALAEGIHPDDVPAEGTRTALIQAAGAGRGLVVEYLLQVGANVRAATRDGKTALGWAARWRHPRIVEQLLAHGADPDQRDINGHPPLVDAINGRDRGDPECVALLLQAGAGPDALPPGHDPQGSSCPFTPLRAAMRHGHAECVALLLDAGADPLLGASLPGLQAPLDLARLFRQGINFEFAGLSAKRQRAIATVFEERGLI